MFWDITVLSSGVETIDHPGEDDGKGWIEYILHSDLEQTRKDAVETALSLVGRVSYFWGGKSLVIGWDSRWGQLAKVWAAGNSTTGTYRPYGLDCSGFMDWIFYNITGGQYILGRGGGATAQHSYCTPISQAQAEPGDLAFYADDSHVGIVVGRRENGKLLVCHYSGCSGPAEIAP